MNVTGRWTDGHRAIAQGALYTASCGAAKIGGALNSLYRSAIATVSNRPYGYQSNSILIRINVFKRV